MILDKCNRVHSPFSVIQTRLHFSPPSTTEFKNKYFVVSSAVVWAAGAGGAGGGGRGRRHIRVCSGQRRPARHPDTPAGHLVPRPRLLVQ